MLEAAREEMASDAGLEKAYAPERFQRACIFSFNGGSSHFLAGLSLGKTGTLDAA